MKKLLVLAIVLFPLIASANQVTCAGTMLVSSLVGNYCNVGDTQFTFVSASAYGTTGTLAVAVGTGGTGASVLSFSDNAQSSPFSSSWSVSYTMQLIPGVAPANNNPLWLITKGGSSIQDLGDNTGVGSLSEQIAVTTGTGVGGTATAADNLGSVSASGLVGGLNASKVTVTDTFTLTAGNVGTANNTFFQADTSAPEPTTMVLMGGALLGLGVFARKRQKKV